MTIYIHRKDESGMYCAGPFPSMDTALGEVHRILRIKKSLGEKWDKVDAPYPFKFQWRNKKTDATMSIKEI